MGAECLLTFGVNDQYDSELAGTLLVIFWDLLAHI